MKKKKWILKKSHTTTLQLQVTHAYTRACVRTHKQQTENSNLENSEAHDLEMYWIVIVFIKNDTLYIHFRVRWWAQFYNYDEENQIRLIISQNKFVFV